VEGGRAKKNPKITEKNSPSWIKYEEARAERESRGASDGEEKNQVGNSIQYRKEKMLRLYLLVAVVVGGGGGEIKEKGEQGLQNMLSISG